MIAYGAVFAGAMQGGVDIFFGTKLHSARTVESDMAEQRNGIVGPTSNSAAIAFRWSSLSGRRPNKYGFMTRWLYVRFDTGMLVDRAGPS